MEGNVSLVLEDRGLNGGAAPAIILARIVLLVAAEMIGAQYGNGAYMLEAGHCLRPTS